MTLVLFPDAVDAIVADGAAGTISPSVHGDLKAAFWFALFAPALVLFGCLTSHALAHEDRALLTMLAWFLVGTAIVGVVIAPVSGFWAVLAIGCLMLRVAPPQPCNVAERAL